MNPESIVVPISAINHFVYCPRRAYLIHGEGVYVHNEHTLRGDLNHEHADHPGFEQRAGWKLLRALPVWSDRLGLNGKADLVEVRESGSRIAEARPVEYKSGRVSKWANDHAQLCAQALCLESMFGVSISEGLIFHAKSQKRTTVAFTPALREQTTALIAELRTLMGQTQAPRAVLKPQCDGCSLRPVCLPEASGRPAFQRQSLFSV
ncbi:MAG: CRISPR-associated protein Cas4 [Terrimicrobiaceae bacterium]|nr:CRISPR-associated protein Cas4 [Terrimicrobiaceae bacterium]